MNGRGITVTCVAVCLLGITGCQSPRSLAIRNSLPPPADGFHWEVFDEIAVAVLAPDGWHRAASKGAGTYTGSVSLEDFKTDGLFKTGFTVQVIAGVKQRTGRPASMLAVAMGQEISESTHNEILATDALKGNGTARSGFIRFRNSPALGTKITVHKFFVALDSSDLLYIYTFESPNETWDEAFKNYGTPMMERIVMTR